MDSITQLCWHIRIQRFAFLHPRKSQVLVATPGLVVYLYPILGTWNFVGSQLLGFLRIWSLPGEDFHDGCCFSTSHLMGHMEFSGIFVISIAIISVGDFGGDFQFFLEHTHCFHYFWGASVSLCCRWTHGCRWR